MQIELAAEHQWHDIRGALRFVRASRTHLGETGRMVIAQLRNARTQTAKRLAVRRQHERIGGHRLIARQRLQVQGKRIAFRLDVEHRHVRRNARQHHVAGSEQPVRRAKERAMFWRMTVARHHLPLARTDAQAIAIADTPELARHRRHERRVIAVALLHGVERCFVGDAVRGEVQRGALAARVGAIARGHHAAHCVFA